MITVEKILEDNAKQQVETSKSNDEVLTTGSTAKKKKPIWPYVVGIGVAAFGIYWLFIRKKSDTATNEGVLSK